QAEDGIRDFHVTGVQTCALPISDTVSYLREWERKVTAEPRRQWRPPGGWTALLLAAREGCAGCARELAKGGADINLTDPENISPDRKSGVSGKSGERRRGQSSAE